MENATTIQAINKVNELNAQLANLTKAKEEKIAIMRDESLKDIISQIDFQLMGSIDDIRNTAYDLIQSHIVLSQMEHVYNPQLNQHKLVNPMGEAIPIEDFINKVLLDKQMLQANNSLQHGTTKPGSNIMQMQMDLLKSYVA